MEILKNVFPNQIGLGNKHNIVLAKKSGMFFNNIKDIFIFTNNFIDLGIVSMLAISHYCLQVGRGQGVC